MITGKTPLSAAVPHFLLCGVSDILVHDPHKLGRVLS